HRDLGWRAPAGYEDVVNLIRTLPGLTKWSLTRFAASLHGEAPQVRESSRLGSVRDRLVIARHEGSGKKRQGRGKKRYLSHDLRPPVSSPGHASDESAYPIVV